MRRFRTPNGKLVSDWMEYFGAFTEAISIKEPENIGIILEHWIEVCPKKWKEDFTWAGAILGVSWKYHDMIVDKNPADDEPKIVSDLRDCFKEMGLFDKDVEEEIEHLKKSGKLS